MDETLGAALARLRDPDEQPAGVRAAWQVVLAADPDVAIAAALDLLAGEPREKPSRRLTIDPGDLVRRRWDLRVTAAAALLDSPAAARVHGEVHDELAHDPQLAADVRAALGGRGAE